MTSKAVEQYGHEIEAEVAPNGDFRCTMCGTPPTDVRVNDSVDGYLVVDCVCLN